MARTLPPSRLKARRRKRRAATVGVIILLILVVAGGIIGLLWLPQIRVQHIDVAGASSVSNANIESDVKAALSGTAWLVVPKDNIFLYPRDKITQMLLNTYPSFESVEVSAQHFDTLSVNITERRALALWCGESLAAASACYLLDGNGVVYAPAANFSGQIYIQYYGSVVGTTTRQFITPDEFRSLSAFAGAVGQVIEGDAPQEIEVAGTDASVTFASGFVLTFSLADASTDVLERLGVALKTEQFTKHPLSDFAYLDLRFGDKLYYKLK